MTSDDPHNDTGTNLPARSTAIDFSLVLSRTIASLQDDPSQLRNAIYELARVKLLRTAWQRDPPVNIMETRRLMLALETAIERVEFHSSRQDELRALQSIDRMLEGPERDPHRAAPVEREPVLIIEPAPAERSDADRLPAFLVPTQRVPLSPKRKRIWPGAAPFLRGGIIAIVLVASYVILDKHFALFGAKIPQETPPVAKTIALAIPTKVAKEQRAQALSPAVQPQSPALPLPGVYGIYGVSNGELYELEALPGRVPDQKVFMSTAIKTPSRTMLPDGRIVFIVFRRDIATAAPDRVAVRVIAKITRAMTFNAAGKANTAALNDEWTIRSTSYDFRVAPVSESPEMLLLRPENSDFVFSAGRYGLVLKGQAYDFTVAGPITDPAQCLERTEAANGSFYSECRRP